MEAANPDALSNTEVPQPCTSSLTLLHRWALLVATSIFPLIWVGGLVTTQDAGMAVPDWPNTNGYNMFAYPMSAWLYGPFDLFIEHGHRLLATLVGVLAIILCAIAWNTDKRRWVRRMCGILLAVIIAQGILGGVRVLLDERVFAMLHGCFGPLVFALAAAIVVVTSKSWLTIDVVPMERPWLRRLSMGLLIASILQLILGAQLRHVQPWTKPSAFVGMVHLHLTLAAMITILVVGVVLAGRSRTNRMIPRIGWLISALFALLVMQIALGVGTWIVNYALPWDDIHPTLARHTLSIKGYWESLVVTGHQATGSLIIAAATALTLRAWRW